MARFNEFGVELPDNYETLQEDELAALADGYEDMARAAQEARMKLNLSKKGITAAERKKRDKEYSENYMRYIRSAEQVRSRIYEVKHRTEAATVKMDSFMKELHNSNYLLEALYLARESARYKKSFDEKYPRFNPGIILFGYVLLLKDGKMVNTDIQNQINDLFVLFKMNPTSLERYGTRRGEAFQQRIL
ncbi:hypothetical protein SAMN02910369_00506 [Lachnospiraceae bacterium NE2001]|nr:hypothetical protein SAMN02910369_00506 [Lachnospiraceae bacterium NE2001]